MTLLIATIAALLLAFGVVLFARWTEAKAWRRSLVAFRLSPPVGLTPEAVAAWLGSIGALTHAGRLWLLPPPPLVLEVVAKPEGISFWLLVPSNMRGAILGSVRAHLAGARIEEDEKYLQQRPRFRVAAEWRLTDHRRVLGVDRAQATAASTLAALQPLAPGELICIQWIVRSGGTPKPIHNSEKQSSDLPWWLDNNDVPADADDLRSMRVKQREGQLLLASGRLGIVAANRGRAYNLFGRVFGTIRQMNAPGAQFVRRLLPVGVVGTRLENISLPLLGYPVALNSREAVGITVLPVSTVPLPGLSLGAARQVPPPRNLKPGVQLAMSNYPGSNQPLTLSRNDRLRSVYVVGPVGVGKSTLLANMAIQDMANGDGLTLIDPKGDLAEDVLARVPDHRRDDVICLGLADVARPIGLNILQAGHGEHGRELAADFTLSVLRSLWAPYWGPRTDDILRACLLTLTHARALDGSALTIVEIPELLTHAPFRRFVTEQPTVPISLRPFWAWYENLSEAERTTVVGPVQNKLRQFTTRSALRLTLGQGRGLDIPALMRERKILVVTLARGVIGSEAAYLLGSLLVASIYQATLGRAATPPEKRRPYWLYLDEFHQVARLSTSLSDMLAESRGLGVGLVMANQYVSQLPVDLRAAVLGTVRSQVAFQVEIDDARLLEPRFAPTLTAKDLTGLPAYEVALKLCSGNQVLAPTTGRTSPLTEPTSDVASLRELSRQHYGSDRVDVEAAIASRLTVAAPAGLPTGRRRRGAGR